MAARPESEPIDPIGLSKSCGSHRREIRPPNRCCLGETAGSKLGGLGKGWVDIIRYFCHVGIMDIKGAVSALSALAQESRLEVFRLLVQRGPRGLAAGEIGHRVGIPATTLSFHLSQLSHAGLVTSRREGRSIIYAADYPSMLDLME